MISQFFCDSSSVLKQLWLFTAESWVMLRSYCIFCTTCFPTAMMFSFSVFFILNHSSPSFSRSWISLLSIGPNTLGTVLAFSFQRHLFWRITPTARLLCRPATYLSPEVCLCLHSPYSPSSAVSPVSWILHLPLSWDTFLTGKSITLENMYMKGQFFWDLTSPIICIFCPHMWLLVW